MFNLQKLIKSRNFPKDCALSCEFNIPLAEYTSFKIGGKADVLFTPKTKSELIRGIEAFAQHDIPISIFGGGTNILIADSGIRGVTIKTNLLNCINLESDLKPADMPPHTIFLRAKAGALINDVVTYAVERGFAGLENFAGLPGTVGGALYMNARCYNKSIEDVFYSAETMTFLNKKCILNHKFFIPTEWNYKKSPFQTQQNDKTILHNKRNIILSAVFSLQYEKPENLYKIAEQNRTDRKQKKQFDFPSCGSVFKNNHLFGKPSGQIIDETGLCGLSCGNAQIAPWHGNFIINRGGASAKNVRQLIQTVQKKVYDKTTYLLEPEVLFVGQDT